MLPSGLNSIDDEAFKGCSSLSEINMPSADVEMGYSVFEDCVKLEKLGLVEE